MEFHLPAEQGTVCLKWGMAGAGVWAFGGGRPWQETAAARGPGLAGPVKGCRLFVGGQGMEGVKAFPKMFSKED